MLAVMRAVEVLQATTATAAGARPMVAAATALSLATRREGKDPETAMVVTPTVVAMMAATTVMTAMMIVLL